MFPQFRDVPTTQQTDVSNGQPPTLHASRRIRNQFLSSDGRCQQDKRL